MKLQHRWSTPAPRLVTASPVHHPQAIVVRDTFSVRALHPEDGAVLWERSVTPPDRMEWAVADAAGVVSCGGGGQDHWIIEAVSFDGQRRYRKALEAINAEAIFAGGHHVGAGQPGERFRTAATGP